MKCPFLLIPAILIMLVACNNPDQGDARNHLSNTLPLSVRKGDVIGSDSTSIPDPLNKLWFSVNIIAREPKEGRYEVLASYGNNDAQGEFILPKGGAQLLPLLKKGPEPFSYVIGFYYGKDDSTFYDYFLVTAYRGSIEMKYLKAYSIK